MPSRSGVMSWARGAAAPVEAPPPPPEEVDGDGRAGMACWACPVGVVCRVGG